MTPSQFEALNELRHAAGFNASSGYVSVGMALWLLAHVRNKRARRVLAQRFSSMLRALPTPEFPN